MKKMMMIFPVLLSACSLAPHLELPKSDVPSAWHQETQLTSSENTPRWEDFGSDELNRLIAAALANNTDMQASLARIEQARASTTIAASSLFPAIDASGSANQNRTFRDAGNVRDNGTRTGLDISYELDLWGKNRDQARAGDARLNAARFDHQALSIVTSAETARLYTGLLALDMRVEVAKKNLDSFREVMRITDARYKAGAISGLEQSQQQATVAGAEAAVASIQNQRELFFNQLALITGAAPANLQVAATSLENLHVPALSVSDPWSLLSRRPDIAASEADLRAANIDIGVARANVLPSVELGLSGALTTSPTSQVVGLAASFFAPIFHGGALQADVKRSEAIRDEALANYRKVLLTAFREVEDALSNYETAQARMNSLAAAAEQSRRAYTITKAQYDSGSVDFQALLDTQRSQLQSEDAALSARQDLFASAIDLIRALGGPYASSKEVVSEPQPLL